jgi:hypothetical protein
VVGERSGPVPRSRGTGEQPDTMVITRGGPTPDALARTASQRGRKRKRYGRQGAFGSSETPLRPEARAARAPLDFGWEAVVWSRQAASRPVFNAIFCSA